jgi:hypothetical protein
MEQQTQPQQQPTRPLWNGPVAATLIGALIGTFGTLTTFRVSQADVNGGNAARIEALSKKLDDTNARLGDFVSKDAFTQFEGQVADIKQDIRDIKESLAGDRTRR